MLINDPIADLAARLKNAILRHRVDVSLPWTKQVEAVAIVLKAGGYLSDFRIDKSSKKPTMILTLKSDNGLPILTHIRRISKPGVRHYVSARKIPKVLGGLGTLIVSTPLGIISGQTAVKKNVGGEVLCEVW